LFRARSKKTGGGDGWADVWKRGCFAWEYKSKGKDLGAALVQLQRYGPALDNPPLLVVSDIDHIEIHTSWTNTVHKVYEIDLVNLPKPDNLQRLRWLFTDPERLRPNITTVDVTDAAAKRFAQIAQRLRDRDFDPQRVAHFLSRIVFCLFAEDVGLLPSRVFARLLDAARKNPVQSETLFRQLFAVMHHGGLFGVEAIEWFNGGLFNDDDALPLQPPDIDDIVDVAKLDWSAIEPSIFGTLFERGLDPSKRSQLGAHYTDPQTIMRIVGPVVEQPLLTEWAACKAAIEGWLAKDKGARPLSSKRKETSKPRQEALNLYKSFLDRLGNFRVLDPACGSGNFLYLALQSLKNIEHRVMLEAEQMGLHREFAEFNVGVQCVQGIELNSYAAELARMTVWIGDISWSIKHGVQLSRAPILKNLERIECRDALMDADGTEAEWPPADAIVGNPPFLGDKWMRDGLGDNYVSTLRLRYEDRVPGGADLVTYWFEKARDQIHQHRACRAGLVATNSITQRTNRKVLERVVETAPIFNAWSDEPWVNEGAAVRVSIVCFGNKTSDEQPILNGRAVKVILADLSAGIGGDQAFDITKARPQPDNRKQSFFGLCLAGRFAVDGDTARAWVQSPNAHGPPNSEVLRPIWNGIDLTRRPQDRWVIDFGPSMAEESAAKYELPFQYVVENVRNIRAANREATRAKHWWRLGRPRPELRAAIVGLKRFIATPETAKHRYFVWMPVSLAPEHRLVVIVRSDDETFGILSSRIHIAWALAVGGTLEDRPVYNSTLCFETFPFPDGFTLSIAPCDFTNPHAGEIAKAAQELNALRENWLNPPEWADRIPEIVPGYPDRIVAKPGHEADLKKRTLTNLYNAKPAWLLNAHRELDQAVAVSYGWQDYTPDVPDDEILRRLLALNLARTPAVK
jgi:type II restriction/modification system DNA methylase subunit YeeA